MWGSPPPPATPLHRFCLQPFSHSPGRATGGDNPTAPWLYSRQNPDLHLRTCTPAQTKPERRRPLPLLEKELWV